MFKILIVEDDSELNKTVCSFLNQSGYEAIGCLNAADAYDKLVDHVIDCKRRILGYITRKIRELPGFPTLYD